jgi:hemolysin activation/secretion protein
MGWNVAIGERSSARSRYATIRVAVHACALILSVAASRPGEAQQPGHQPRPNPQQIGKTFETFQVEQTRADRAAPRMPSVARPEISADATPLFELTAVSVVGARTLPAVMIAESYRSYIGRVVSQLDLATIAGKISDLYRHAGYHLSRAIVPPQDIKNGRIRIQVIEGSIAEIVLKGQGAEQFGVRSLLDVVVAEHPSRLETLERQLLLVNDRPGVRIADTALEEIGTATGGFRLIVYLATWRIYTAAGLDNLGSSAVGPLQAFLPSAYNSYFIKGDTLGLNLSTIPNTPRELAFGRLSYEVPIGANGLRLGAAALYSDVAPGDARRILDTHTRTETFELRGTIAPLQTQRSSLWLTATAGYSDVAESDALGTNYSDHIRTVSLTADYRLHDDLAGWNYLTVIYRQGIDVLGASHAGDALLSNDGASSRFSLLNFAFTRYQNHSDIWSIKMSAAGQVASAPLLTSQQFYLGGAAFGRAFDSGLISGDNGIAGSVELRFDQKLNHELFKSYQLYAFFDSGVVWNFGDGTDDIQSLLSVGAGVRLYLGGEMQAGVAIAAPVSYRSPINEGRGSRILFSLSNSLKLCPDRAQMRCF